MSKVIDPFDTYASHENGDMPDFYLGDFGHDAVPTKLRNPYRQDLINIRECFKKLIYGTIAPLERVQVDKVIFVQQGYSTDLALIWQNICDLERACTIQEDLDLRFLERFILFLGKLYPKSRTAPLRFSGPTSVPKPSFFNSKEQLLARHGNMDGGPWYICSIRGNNDLEIDDTPYGLPGQEPPRRDIMVTNPDTRLAARRV